MAPIILSEEMQSSIDAKVREYGLSDASEYIALLVKQDQQPLINGGSGKLSADELRTMLVQIAEGSERLPSLPTSAFTRESFYKDRP